MADTSANCQERAALRTNSQSTECLKSMSVVQRHAYAIRLAKERSTSTPAYLKHVYLGLRPGLRPTPVTEGGAGKWGVGHA